MRTVAKGLGGSLVPARAPANERFPNPHVRGGELALANSWPKNGSSARQPLLERWESSSYLVHVDREGCPDQPLAAILHTRGSRGALYRAPSRQPPEPAGPDSFPDEELRPRSPYQVSSPWRGSGKLRGFSEGRA